MAKKNVINNTNVNGGGVQGSVTIDGIPPRVQEDFAKTHPVAAQPVVSSPPKYIQQPNFEKMKEVVGWSPEGQPVFGGGVQQATVDAQPTGGYFGQGGKIYGKFDAQPMVGGPSGSIAPIESGQLPQSNFERVGNSGPAVTAGWTPEGNPVYDNSLAGMLRKNAQAKNDFQKDDTQRDGGFFKWLGGLFPKKRNGMREDETPDEYDERMTRNKQMYMTFANAIRHMGNIINTSKGAPVQQFNDPNLLLEQGLQTRKADRAKKGAAAADAAYKQANLDLKKQSAENDKAYKNMQLQINLDRLNHQKERDNITDQKWKAKFDFDAAKDDRDFKYKQIRDKVKDGQWQAGYGIKVANLKLSQARFAHTLSKDAKGGSGGSVYAYATPYGSLFSKKQISAQQEKQMWDFMVRNKQITPQKLKEYQAAANGDGGKNMFGGTNNGSRSKARDIIQKAIAYGLMDATDRGDAFRDFCVNNLGMGEDRVYNTPHNATTWKRGSVKRGSRGKLKI